MNTSSTKSKSNISYMTYHEQIKTRSSYPPVTQVATILILKNVASIFCRCLIDDSWKDNMHPQLNVESLRGLLHPCFYVLSIVVFEHPSKLPTSPSSSTYSRTNHSR